MNKTQTAHSPTATPRRERISTAQDIERIRRCYVFALRPVDLPNWVEYRFTETMQIVFEAFEDLEGGFTLACSSAGVPPPPGLRMYQIPPIHRPERKSYIANFCSRSAMIDALIDAN